VLSVEGGPEQAKQAAQKGLAVFAGDKPIARPEQRSILARRSWLMS